LEITRKTGSTATMKQHGNTGKRNAAKAPEKVKSIIKCIRFTSAEIDAQDKARGSVSWSKWARAALMLAALCEIAQPTQKQ
jgi:hypothetical protein